MSRKKKYNKQKKSPDLFFLGEVKVSNPSSQLFSYNATEYLEKKSFSDYSSLEYLNESGIHWLNTHGLHDVDIIQKIGNVFQIHKLILQDILNTEQRPKAEEFKDSIFFTLKSLRLSDQKVIEIEQISFVLGNSYVISFQEDVADIFSHIRDRIRQGLGLVRQKKADFLLFLLLDAVVNNYFLVIDDVEERIDHLEKEVINTPSKETLFTIEHIKKDLIFIKRSIAPLKEAILLLEKGGEGYIEDASRKYFSDLRDNVLSILDAIDTNRQLLESATNIYLSGLSNKMNEVMKVLTIIATIFIPLTFIAGIYGMNFNYMPELYWKWSYPIILICMGLLFLGMLAYFKQKKWF